MITLDALKMKNKKLLPLSAAAIAVFGGISSLAWANNADQMVVTANRFEQPISSILAPITVVTREDIDHWQSNTVVDVLRRLPGVDIAQNGGMGQLSSIYIRGTEAKHTLVLIDGVRLNNAGIAGNPNINQFPIALVQRLEYIRGARSAIYGSDAIGGVINIITRRDDIGSNLTAGIGSNGFQSYTGTTQQKIGDRTQITASGGYTYTKGYDIIRNYSGKERPSNPHYGFLNKTLWLGVDHQFSSQFDGFARVYGYDNRTRYASMGNNIQEVENRTYDTGLNFNQDDYSSQLIFSYNHTKDYNFYNPNGRYAQDSTLDDSKQYNVQWGNYLKVYKGGVSGGVDYLKQSIEPGTAMTSKSESISNNGLYLSGQQELDSIIIEGAIRSDHHSDFGWHTTWQSSLGWEFIEGYRLVGSYATAYKAPNIGQLYAYSVSSWGTIVGNPNLKPEESQQWEIGLEGLTGPLSWQLSAYRNQIDNLIDSRKGINQTPSSYYNIKKATIKGIEWTGDLDTWIFHHQLTYQYIDPKDNETNKVLLRRAKQQVKYQLDWNIEKVNMGLTYQYIGSRYDTDYPRTIKQGGFSLWDATAAYPVTDHLTIRGRIANLLDKDYETAYGYRTPGREFFLTGSYNF